MELFGYQNEAIEKCRVFMRNGILWIIIDAPTGAGKCLAPDTLVLLSNGQVRRMDDVRETDYLMGPDGKPRTIWGINRGRGPMVDIIPNKGQAWRCTADHVLTLIRTSEGGAYDKGGDIVDIPLNEYRSSSKWFRHTHKLMRTGWDLPEKDLPIHPWLLGVLLGDGSLKQSVVITTSDTEIESAVRELASEYGVTVKIDVHGGRTPSLHLVTPRGQLNPLRESLKDMELCVGSADKFVPLMYRHASAEQRRELLAGLIDADGHLSKGYFDYISKSRRLAYDVAFLARSCGLSASLAPKIIRYAGDLRIYYRVSISGACIDIPTRVKRKQAKPRRQKKDPLRTGFKCIDAGEGDWVGCMVSGDGRFLLADGTVTHNTEIAMAIVKAAAAKGKMCEFICDRQNLVNQTSERFTNAGIDHGILMGKDSVRLCMPIRISSAQTIESRGLKRPIVKPGAMEVEHGFADLYIVDECHDLRVRKLIPLLKESGAFVIGLTATSFKKELASFYEKRVTVRTTRQLIGEGRLARLEVVAPVVEIDTNGIPISAGEFQKKELTKRVLQIVGDVVPEWEKQVDERYGGEPQQTIGFFASIDETEAFLEKFREAGHDFRMIHSKIDPDKARDLIEQFKQGKFMGILNCAMLCLDDQTEILTARGWKGVDDLRMNDAVASFDKNIGLIEFHKPKFINMSNYDGPMVAHPDGRFRVTANHRMLVRSPGARRWKTVHASEMVGMSRQVPVSGVAVPLDVAGILTKEKKPKGSYRRRVVATSYKLRKDGWDSRDALVEAERRTCQKDALRYKDISELTEDECRFIGFWLGDGTREMGGKGGHAYSVVQSERYPKIVGWFDALVERTGFSCKRTRLKKKGNMTARAVRWFFARGTGVDSQKGVYSIERFLDKNARYLLGMTRIQFLALWEGLVMADGSHGENSRPGSQISTVNDELADNLMAVAVCRGMRATKRKGITPRKKNHRQIYHVYITDRIEAIHLGAGTVPMGEFEDVKNERIWCVSVPNEYIVTRRSGHVTIVGNSRGSDFPNARILVNAYPTRSMVNVVQKFGRIIRTFPSKEYGLLIDHAGDFFSFYEPLRQFYTFGPPEFGEDVLEKVKRAERPRTPRTVCKKCGTAFEVGAPRCLNCGAKRPVRQASDMTPPRYVNGRLEQIDTITGETIPLNVNLWEEVCAATLRQCNGEEGRARRRAKPAYKAITGQKLVRKQFKVVDREPNPLVNDMVLKSFRAWMIRQRHARKPAS